MSLHMNTSTPAEVERIHVIKELNWSQMCSDVALTVNQADKVDHSAAVWPVRESDRPGRREHGLSPNHYRHDDDNSSSFRHLDCDQTVNSEGNQPIMSLDQGAVMKIQEERCPDVSGEMLYATSASTMSTLGLFVSFYCTV